MHGSTTTNFADVFKNVKFINTPTNQHSEIDQTLNHNPFSSQNNLRPKSNATNTNQQINKSNSKNTLNPPPSNSKYNDSNGGSPARSQGETSNQKPGSSSGGNHQVGGFKVQFKQGTSQHNYL